MGEGDHLAQKIYYYNYKKYIYTSVVLIHNLTNNNLLLNVKYF